MSQQHELLVIDDLTTGDFNATSGKPWKLVTDTVMGGVSKGQLSLDKIQSRNCLRMQGEVRLDNNGGFVQMALNLPDNMIQHLSAYTGIYLQVYGNNQQYNIHLRTDYTTLPWQSYRATFIAESAWKIVYLPFTKFEPYRINKTLDTTRLKRIGIVAIGREFRADLCVGEIGLYH